jgi:hypothetical protein
VLVAAGWVAVRPRVEVIAGVSSAGVAVAGGCAPQAARRRTKTVQNRINIAVRSERAFFIKLTGVHLRIRECVPAIISKLKPRIIYARFD